MTAEFGSRSDLEALQRSGRGKVVAVVLLMLVAAAGAAWSFLRDEGIGDAEDPTKVLVVSRGTTVGYSGFLKDLGFDAAEGTLAAWQTKAEAEVEDLEVTGVEAVLTLADKFGYGYVVFESPAEVDFSGIEIDGGLPELGDDVRFGVLSVGDFAFPHRMTVNPEPSPVIRDPGMSMLQALFAQDELAKVLPDNENPEIPTIQLRDTLSDALDHLARIPAAEEMAQRVMADVRSSVTDDERAEPRPELLTTQQESSTPLPLPNGSVMTMGRQFSVVTRGTVRADLELDSAERFFYGPADAAPESRKVCTALAGGEMSVDDSARYAFAADGGAILIKNLSDGMLLWVLDPWSGGCGFKRLGTVPPAAVGVEPLGVPHRSGAVARTGTVDGRAVVEVAGVLDGQTQLLGMLAGVEFAEPAWIDSKTLVVIGQDADGLDGLYLLRTDAPLRVLRLDASIFESATELAQVAIVGGEGAGGLVVTAGSFPRKVYHIVAPSSFAALFENPPQAEPGPKADADSQPETTIAPPPAEAADEGLPRRIDLDPTPFTVVAITHAGQAFDPTVSPDGKWVAMGLRDRDLDRPDASDDAEIAVAPLNPEEGRGKLRLLTRNALRDHSPRFSSDGAWVVFETRVEIPRTDWSVTLARRAKVAP